MTCQEELLEIIRSEPGIEQRELMKRGDLNPSNTSHMLDALRKYKLIERVPTSRTFKLYPAGALI